MARALVDVVTTPGAAQHLAARRRRLQAAARGTVVELGGGPLHRLADYRHAGEVWVVEPDPGIASELERTARGVAPEPLRIVVVPDLEATPDTVDTVVAFFALSRAEDPGRLAAGLRDRLGPDGRLLFCEHARPPRTLPGADGPRAIAATLASFALGRCHDLPATLRASGFTVLSLNRFRVRALVPGLRDCVQGVARRTVPAAAPEGAAASSEDRVGGDRGERGR